MLTPTVTFHEQIAANRRNSLLLVMLIALLLALLGFTLGYGITGSLGGGVFGIAVAAFLALLLSAGSYLGGEGLVLSAAGAREVTEATAPRLVNVVQELAIAANIPMPRVHVIDDSAPNAFAVGRDP